ncbi:MAG: nucleoside triphosphate pyrophosphohydrolase [Dehalococcoidia bacterium]|nr:nucleoside triphosphate pyrophosphohydrolase [Dehalococcoidia bacterium]
MDIPPELKRFESLVQVVASLRGPNGCPWDRAQTHESLREHLLEESYEALEALDDSDRTNLCSELGDLLLQIVLHAQIGKESGEFEIGDVVEAINRKLISRHPHVFGETSVKDVSEVLIRWEELKKNERQTGKGMLDGVPKTLPSLAYSQAVQERVSRVGFDCPKDEEVLDKLSEEIKEYQEVSTAREKSMELGDVLFTLANYARRQNIDLESALREANQKFYNRFSYMENLCREREQDLTKMTLEEKNELWSEAKRAGI